MPLSGADKKLVGLQLAGPLHFLSPAILTDSSPGGKGTSDDESVEENPKSRLVLTLLG